METPRDPDCPDPVLERLLQRRARKYRHSRARGGKSYQSWGEYAPRSLHTTGDTSHTNMWFYVIMGCAAPMVPVFIYHAAVASSVERNGYSATENAIWFASSMAPYALAISGFALLLVAGSRLRIWSETRRRGASLRDISGGY